MAIYLENQANNNTLLGVTGDTFKVNHAINVTRKRSRQRILHLGPAKPTLSVVTGEFISVISGAYYEVSGFHYQSRDNTFNLVNLTPADEPMLLYEPESYLIPITFTNFQQETDIIHNFHLED